MVQLHFMMWKLWDLPLLYNTHFHHSSTSICMIWWSHIEVGQRDVFQLAPWWRNQMETFSALLALCAGNSPVTGEFPTKRPVTRSFDVFFNLRLNKRFSKQSWGWWFETPSRSLWRHCNDWDNHGHGDNQLEIHMPITRNRNHQQYSQYWWSNQEPSIENIWYVNITRPIIFQFFIYLTSFVVAILIKFNCFTIPFFPNLEDKSVVPKLTTRDNDHCWWTLFSSVRPVDANIYVGKNNHHWYR